MFSVYSFQKSKRRKITHCKLQLEEGRVANIYASLALEICIFFVLADTNPVHVNKAIQN